MALRIVAGRQEPAPGSRRERNMRQVANWIDTHGDATYRYLANQLGISFNQARDAAWDLRVFHPEYYREPAAANGNTFGKGWNTNAKRAEITRIKTLATQDETMAERFDKAARETTDPVEATLLREEAMRCRRVAVRRRRFAATLAGV